jgi:hypothetical protein
VYLDISCLVCKMGKGSVKILGDILLGKENIVVTYEDG